MSNESCCSKIQFVRENLDNKVWVKLEMDRMFTLDCSWRYGFCIV